MFVFVPLVFSLGLTNLPELIACVITFAAFCLASSSVYILNDLLDVDKDRLHPVKSMRPIASGAIPTHYAAVFGSIILVGCVALASAVNLPTVLIIIGYLIVNIAYSLYLKHKPIFDCFCIAAGFVLRVYAGSTASGNKVSDWLFLSIISMSLFMAFGKRRGEMLKTNGSETRKVLSQYNLGFLNGMVFVCAGLSIVFYSLWAMVREYGMIYTVPIVIFIVCKYLLFVHDDSHSDPTTVIFSSKTLIVACVAYAVLTVLLLYFIPEGLK